MAHDVRFGPCAQPPEQRAWVLQLQAAVPALKTKATPRSPRRCARYEAGRLSWPAVRQALAAVA